MSSTTWSTFAVLFMKYIRTDSATCFAAFRNLAIKFLFNLLHKLN